MTYSLGVVGRVALWWHDLVRDMVGIWAVCLHFVSPFWIWILLMLNQHLPTDIEPHLKEIIELVQEGKIRHVGVSNFNLKECKLAKRILEDAGLKLYGVQNHYSIISRVNKGIVPVCGCRKPKQVKELAEATNVVLTKKEIKILELSADKANARIMGPDLFRPFVKKEKRNLSF